VLGEQFEAGPLHEIVNPIGIGSQHFVAEMLTSMVTFCKLIGDMAKPKLPENLKRVGVYGKIAPSTMQFLTSLGEDNSGRAIDRVVRIALGVEQLPEQTSSEPASQPPA